MSTTPEPEVDLELHFLPAWAKQSPETNRFSNFEGREERARPGRGPDRDRGRGDRPRPERRDRPENRGGPGGPRREGGGGRRDERGPRRFEPRREEAPLPPVNVALEPEAKGVESLARQIKLTGRAYPLFDIAFLILKKPERYNVAFSVQKKPDGEIAQPLFVCNLDDSLWLSEAEAVQQVLRKHFDTFYQTERTPTEAPKGTYTFVAQCGMSGTILGPPNYHDYQMKLHKLHAERFSRMPFEAFKARVKMVKDEAVVKQWIEEQSFKTEYVTLNVPEPIRLASPEAVEAHFREVHLSNLVKQVEFQTLPGPAAHAMPNGLLRQMARHAGEEQSRFPLKVVNVLSQQFASHGLQFFKVNKTVTHVAVARPHYLDVQATPVSAGIKRILEFIDNTPDCTRQKLLAALAPESAPAPAEGQEAKPAEPSAANAVVSDLHWLIHQGHVIEFANGILDTAKAPKPKPAPARPKPKPIPAAETAQAAPAAGAPAELTSAGPEPAKTPAAEFRPESEATATVPEPTVEPAGEAPPAPAPEAGFPVETPGANEPERSDANAVHPPQPAA